MKKVILRFNIKEFKNAYSLMDLLRMQLNYYAVEVGLAKEKGFNIENEIKKNLGDPIYSRFDHFIKFEELNKAAKEEIIDSAYADELIKYNKEDQKLINEQNINNKLKERSSALNNAREIRKIMIQVMLHILIEKL